MYKQIRFSSEGEPMDKYDEAAGALRDILRPPCECLNCQVWLVDRMADMLRLYDAQRAKETCKWTRDKDGEVLRTECETDHETLENLIRFCPTCGRPIEEVKEER